MSRVHINQISEIDISYLYKSTECDPNQKLLNQMAITLKICISDPMFVKAKMCFGGLHLFWKIVNKQLKNENKWRPPKHILALTTWAMGSKMHIFRVVAIWISKFWFGLPCRIGKNIWLATLIVAISWCV